MKKKRAYKKELDIFRQLSIIILVNKLYIDYKIALDFLGSLEPEGYVENWMKINFPGLPRKMKNSVWHYFLMNLVANKRRIKK